MPLHRHYEQVSTTVANTIYKQALRSYFASQPATVPLDLKTLAENRITVSILALTFMVVRCTGLIVDINGRAFRLRATQFRFRDCGCAK